MIEKLGIKNASKDTAHVYAFNSKPFGKEGFLMKRSRLILLSIVLVIFGILFLGMMGTVSAAPKEIAIETFTEIDFVEDICWKFSVSSGNIQYTNRCVVGSDVVVTLLDGTTQKTFTVAPNGKLIFLGGSVVHIIGERPQ